MENSRRQTTPPSPQGSNKRPRVAEENRRRAARACDGCRRLKEKCEGGVPCNRCTRSGRHCESNHGTTSASGQSRQRQHSPGSVDSEERIKHLEKIAAHFLGDVSLSLSSLRAIAEKISGVQSDVHHVSEDLENLTLEDEKFVVKSLSHNTAHYSGEFSHWNFSQKVRRRVDQCLLDNVTEDIDRNYKKMGITEHWRATQLQSPASNVFALLQSLPPRHVVDFLVDVYFKYAQTNLFFVEERWIRKKLEILQETPTAVASNDAGWICAVLMVLAIGTQFAHMVSGPSTNVDGTAKQKSDPSEDDVGVTFYHVACKLVPDVITIASLESVQACLLLAHYALPLDTQGLAYTYLGLAIKVAIQNGMHRKYNGNEFDAHAVETRNRLWWTAYTLEKRISILHGRPPSITPNDIDVDLPVDRPELNLPDTASRYQNISALIHLTCRLGDISHTIFLLRKCPKRLQSNYFDRLFELRSQLRNWWSSLPAIVCCRDLTSTSPLFRHNIHLKLCFHLNEIYMGRPFIFFTDAKSPSPRSDVGAASSYSTSQPLPQRSKTRATLVADAESAALETIELCGLLNEHYGLARASYTEFSSCRAAMLVILAQSLNEQTETLRSALTKGMTLIKRMAVSIDSMKSEVSVIEALETAIKRLDIGNIVQKHQDGTEKGNQYEKFRSWAALWKGEQEGHSLVGSHSLSEPMNFPSTSSWTSDFRNPDIGCLDGATGSTMDNQLIDLGMGTDPFVMPDFGGQNQWDVPLGNIGTGMSFDEYAQL